MYHAVVREPLEVADWCFLEEELFRRQVQYVRDACDVIPLSSVMTKIGEGSISRPTAAITFDDGFQNNYEVAFPILREAGLPATVFLTTGLIGTSDTVWFCRLNRALAQTRNRLLEWNGHRFSLTGINARESASATLQSLLKALPHPRLLSALREIVLTLGDDPDAPIAVDSPYRMLSLSAIESMTASGLIELGAHTRSHAILSLLTPEEQREEIVDSVDRVRELTRRPTRLFAYPNGRRADYDGHTVRMLEALGVDSAVTAIDGTNDTTTPALELRRLGVGGGACSAEFDRVERWAKGAG
jgi:peptidoglycan/xylan/chitin deacetylase (PgdA/CDA1 family)